jgi:tetratricopeptide (TPR) repeat protein
VGLTKGVAKQKRLTNTGAGRKERQGPARGGLGRFRGWLGLGVVLVVTACLYAPALNHQFTNWDDDRQITANPDIRDLSPEGIGKIFSSFYVSLYQPLTSLSWAVEYRLFGLNPRVYHAVNVLLHLANILLVYVLVRALSQNVGISLVTTALFAVHPLQVEVAAWVSSRSILLSSLFYLGAMIAYIAYAKSGKLRYFALGLVLFVPALLAKTTAATLPLVLIVIDIYLQRKVSRWTVLEKVPFFLLSIVFGCITMLARGGVSHVQDFALKYSLVQRICIVCYSSLWYVGKLVFPADLSVFYPFPVKANGWLPVAFYLAPALLIGLAVGIWYAGRYRRLLAFAALFMLASLVLVVQIVPVSELMVCDRYAYLPCIGLFFLVGTLGQQIGSRNSSWMRAMLVGAALVLIALGGVTHRRIGVWRDSMTLWNDLIQRRQDIWVAYLNRGREAYENGDRQAAIADFNVALQLNPKSDRALNNRAAAYVSVGDHVAALRDFDAAIRLNPDNSYLINRGILKRNTGDLAGALQDFDAVIERNPQHAEALRQRADTFRKQGNWTKAIADYEDSLRLDPKSDQALNGRAISYACLGNRSAALRDFDEAIRLNPADSSYVINRGILKRDMGDFAGAVRDFDTVVELNSRNVRALCERADAYRMQGNWARARADYEAVLRLNPGHAYAAFLLGAVLVQTGDNERAVTMLNKALTLGCKDPGPVYYLLGQAYQKMGRMDLAKEAFRHCQELGYRGPQVPPRPVDRNERP